MTSVDELFRSSTGGKRKFEASRNPDEIYKAAKLSASDTTRSASHGRDAREDQDPEQFDSDEEAGPARPADEDEPENDDEEGRFFGGGVNANQAEALDYVDQQDAEQSARADELNAAWVRRTAQAFEKRINTNAELRSKFQDDPAKFMDSEAELDADIKALSLITEQPALYPELVKSGTVERLVMLLAHENTDIAIEAIAILAELIDEDVQAEQGQWSQVTEAMLEADLPSLLLQNLQRLDETEDADQGGVYHSLSLIENIASLPSAAERLVSECSLLQWLLQRIQRHEDRVGQNKQYAAEVFAILLQSSMANRAAALALDAVDTVLQLLSTYRKRDPSDDSDEEEYAENLFDSLVCLVDDERGKQDFVKAEGLELCLIMLREGKFSKSRALRVLDHALGGDAGHQACQNFVEQAGLKPLFALFSKSKDQLIKEHALAIFASLLRQLPGDSAPRIRLLAKFFEKDYEKTAQLIKLRRDYMARIRPVDEDIALARSQIPPAEHGAYEDEWLSQRLGAGLFSLQTIDVILAWLVAEDAGAKSYIASQLGPGDLGLQSVRKTLEEQLQGIDETKADEPNVAVDMLRTLLGFLP